MQCAKRVGIPQNIDTCMDTESGTVLQLDAEQITSSFAPKFIPTIIYDGVSVLRHLQLQLWL